MFQPTFVILETEITIATLIMGGQIETSHFVVPKCMSIKFFKTKYKLR